VYDRISIVFVKFARDLVEVETSFEPWKWISNKYIYTYCPILLISGKSVNTKETLANFLENTFKNESVGERTD
jgi:hypothetical protein